VPPGYTLAETLTALKMSYEELCERTGLSRQYVRGILKGERMLTPGIALLLEEATTVPVRMWDALEANYRAALAAEREQSR